MSQSFMKIVPVVFELRARVGDTTWGSRVHKLDRYPLRKNENVTRTVPVLKSILHIFHLTFFSLIDNKIFINGGGLVGGRWIFFLHNTLLFHQCNNKKHISAVL